MFTHSRLHYIVVEPLLTPCHSRQIRLRLASKMPDFIQSLLLLHGHLCYVEA